MRTYRIGNRSRGRRCPYASACSSRQSSPVRSPLPSAVGLWDTIDRDCSEAIYGSRRTVAAWIERRPTQVWLGWLTCRDKLSALRTGRIAADLLTAIHLIGVIWWVSIIIIFIYATADEADAYMFYRCFFLFFLFIPVRHKNTRQPFSGTAERIFMKLTKRQRGKCSFQRRTEMRARPNNFFGG